MELIEGDALLDGGTTCLTILRNNKKQYITFDYSLPHDGRARHIYLSDEQYSTSDKDHLPINSTEEKEITQWLIQILLNQFKKEKVEAYIKGSLDNFGEGKWFFALNFLRLVVKERGTEL